MCYMHVIIHITIYTYITYVYIQCMYIYYTHAHAVIYKLGLIFEVSFYTGMQLR